jgi:predicted ArsR family transcriptional regulator
MSRRDEVLTVLRERGEAMSITEIADVLGTHVNTVRFHLDKLLGTGQVELVAPERRGPGRPPQRFVAVRAMDPTGPRHYGMLAEVLAAGLASEADPSRRAAEAGRAWGRGVETGTGEPIGLLVQVLDDLDFAPQLLDGEELPVVGLRHCPFLELVHSRADVVCPVHLGVMQGVLVALDADVTVERLEAFAEPDLCTAHLVAVGS